MLSQRDPGLRLRKRSEGKDEESKENLDNGAGCGDEKRLSQANGDMDIPWDGSPGDIWITYSDGNQSARD